jgi:hypothetical protein
MEDAATPASALVHDLKLLRIDERHAAAYSALLLGVTSALPVSDGQTDVVKSVELAIWTR